MDLCGNMLKQWPKLFVLLVKNKQEYMIKVNK